MDDKDNDGGDNNDESTRHDVHQKKKSRRVRTYCLT